jgi:hypothetical protein
MKTCSRCGKEMPDDALVCDVDGRALREEPESNDSSGFPIGSIILWLVAMALLLGTLGLVGLFLLRLGSGIWAALDCAHLGKKGYRGYRALGIVFKPVVVFGVCAFFFGRIWVRLVFDDAKARSGVS